MSDALLWNEIGNVYQKLGSHQEAIAAFTKAIELDPDSGWFYCNLGHVYSLSGQFGQAILHFRRSLHVMESSKDQAVVWNKIGDAYRALKDMDNAILAYRKADDLDLAASSDEKDPGSRPGNQPDPRESLKNANFAPVENILTPFPLGTNEQDGFLIEDRPQAAKENSQNGLPAGLQESAPRLPSGSDRNPDPQVPASTAIDSSRLEKELDNTSQPGKKPLIVIPDPNEEAATLPNRAISPNDRSRNSGTDARPGQSQDGRSKGHSELCPVIENLEEILAKVNIYENITRVNSNNDRAWDTLGKLYKSLGRYKDAISAYQKAIKLAPDREIYYYYLGLLFSVEQQHDNAVQAFQVVLQKNPNYFLAHSALAGVYHRMGLENKANHHIATALPKMNGESAYNRACFYAICGDTELALEFLQLALNNKDTTIEWIKSDPDLDPIRTSRRYQELISEQDQAAPQNSKDNYFSSELEGAKNRLLPILNHSLER